jgi:hypothetical protein
MNMKETKAQKKQNPPPRHRIHIESARDYFKHHTGEELDDWFNSLNKKIGAALFKDAFEQIAADLMDNEYGLHMSFKEDAFGGAVRAYCGEGAMMNVTKDASLDDIFEYAMSEPGYFKDKPIMKATVAKLRSIADKIEHNWNKHHEK